MSDTHKLSASRTETESEIESEISSAETRYTTDSHRYGQLRKNKVIASAFREPKGKSDDAHKQRVINTNKVKSFWGCKLGDSLPIDLKPRLPSANGRRIGLKQQDTRRLPTKQWTKAFFRALEDLAFVTCDDKATAHTKVFAKVKERQRNGTHPEHYAREVLTSDLQAVAQEFKRLKSAGHYPPKSLRRKGGSRIPRDDREASDVTEDDEQPRDTSVVVPGEVEMGGVTPPLQMKRKAEDSAPEHSIKRRKPSGMDEQSDHTSAGVGESDFQPSDKPGLAMRPKSGTGTSNEEMSESDCEKEATPRAPMMKRKASKPELQQVTKRRKTDQNSESLEQSE
ncbi:hypothetical protein LTR56_006868 [Elasticomyces elasticus]|nr:hypothetical protein LTR22_016701 [Elasticomyces elasticus]KAK3649392.1 hypothetical protein LTR56_006868 [Elasticomyces elasticus]KAK4928075.1 hypothetical protein LTR49_005274 [Elasticomyces elasticus]KAK5748303.1 hypothetical protein LTS12_021642 [Elasticomyces elasticus]